MMNSSTEEDRLAVKEPFEHLDDDEDNEELVDEQDSFDCEQTLENLAAETASAGGGVDGIKVC